MAAVVVFHYRPSWLPAGFLGVDVFFVLSGFLITSLLLVEHANHNSVDLVGFWMRRIRRLLPAMYLVVAAVVAYAAWWVPNASRARLRGDVISTVLYYANTHLIGQGGSYATRFGERSPLQHTWSLAIEEQFYLVWPLVFFVLGRNRAPWSLRRRVVFVATAGMLASTAALILRYDAQRDPLRAYYGTDTRVHALFVGVLLAALVNARPRLVGISIRAQRVVISAGVVALAAIAYLMRTLDYFARFLYLGGFGLVAVLAGLVVLAAAQTGTNPTRRLLEASPLRLLGRVSYGVYLWHWPVLVVVHEERVGFDGVALLSLQLGIVAILTTLSYLLVERPIRRRKVSTRRILLSSAIAGGGLIVAAIWATNFSVATARGASHRSVPPTVVSSAGPVGSPVASDTEVQRGDGESPSAAFGTSAVSAAPSLPRKVMLLGDSVAWTLGGGVLSFPQPDTYVSPFSAERITLWNLARYGCGITPGSARVGRVDRPPLGTCLDWEKTWGQAVDQFRPDLVVFSQALWESYDHRVEGRVVAFGSPEADALYLATLQRLRAAVTVNGARLVLLSSPMYASTEGELGAESSDYWRYQRLNALHDQFANAHPDNVSVVDLGGFVCTDLRCHEPLPDGARLRSDGVHFTPEAAAWIAPWLTEQLELLPRARR